MKQIGIYKFKEKIANVPAVGFDIPAVTGIPFYVMCEIRKYSIGKSNITRLGCWSWGFNKIG